MVTASEGGGEEEEEDFVVVAGPGLPDRYPTVSGGGAVQALLDLPGASRRLWGTLGVGIRGESKTYQGD